MTVPTTSWDETSPAGAQALAQGDDRIREMKTQIREVIDIDHDFPSSGQDSGNGQHKKVTLQEQADLGTGAVNATLFGSQTVSGKGEAVYTDEDDNDVQLTNQGTPIAISAVTAKATPVAADAILLNDSEASNVSKSLTLANLLKVIYPVGSIYINANVATNPGTLLGFGTWTAFGSGRAIVGLDSGDTDFDVGEETGGSKTHTLLTAEMPAHTHVVPNVNGNNTVNGSTNAGTAGGSASNKTSNSTGGDGAHNNVQPYIVCYLWKRTA